jgi:hypothetical protein
MAFACLARSLASQDLHDYQDLHDAEKYGVSRLLFGCYHNELL